MVTTDVLSLTTLERYREVRPSLRKSELKRQTSHNSKSNNLIRFLNLTFNPSLSPMRKFKSAFSNKTSPSGYLTGNIISLRLSGDSVMMSCASFKAARISLAFSTFVGGDLSSSSLETLTPSLKMKKRFSFV
jgi:hypothetical protein